jgi:hypothetical protein
MMEGSEAWLAAKDSWYKPKPAAAEETLGGRATLPLAVTVMPTGDAMKDACSAAVAGRTAAVPQSLLATTNLKGRGAEVAVESGRVSSGSTGNAGECHAARAALPCKSTPASALSSAPPLFRRQGEEGLTPQAAGAGAEGM